MKRMFASLLITVATLWWAGDLYALSADEIVKKSQEAFLYQGDDFKARVMMKLTTQEGKERIREMTMLRKDYKAGEQKYFIYFFQPADVRDMTFMVYKYPERDDDRWLFVPAINMVRRIAARDRASSFVGSDFTYEDVSGRDPEDDTHEIVREEMVIERICYVIKSVPKAGDMDWAYRLSWIDKANFLPLKEEYYDRNSELYRVFAADEVREIGGFPTVVKRTMKNLQSGHRTEVTFMNAAYDLGMADSLFSERFLRRPPEKWIK